jgi:hypothetical protein
MICLICFKSKAVQRLRLAGDGTVSWFWRAVVQKKTGLTSNL